MNRKSKGKKPKKLKVIWEYDKDMPEEERQERLGKVFEILLEGVTLPRDKKKQMNFDWEHFKCKKCGKCCIGIGLPWPESRARLDEIATFLKIAPEELVTKYVGKIVEKDGKRFVERFDEDEDIRCPFLSADNSCLIYEVRPDPCRMYPVETDFGRCDVDCLGFD